MSKAIPAVGSVAPDFTLPATGESSEIQLSSLRGAPVIVYFYPKDSTPGCTTQACDFRDSIQRWSAAGIQVLGISPDSLASHERFSAKQELNFPLLVDEGAKVSDAWGVWQLKKNFGREYMGIVRTTFLLDAEGVVRRVWEKVRVKGHVEEVLQAAEALKNGTLDS